MSFKTNTPVVQGIVSSQITAALGSSIQAHSTLLDSVSGLALSGGAGKAVVVNTAGTGVELSAALGTAAFATLGTATGNVPVVGVDGKLAASLLPSMDVVNVNTVADLAARDALAPSKGDVVVVASESKTYIYSGTAWVEMISPSSAGGVASVAGKTGIVTLSLSDLTDVDTTGHVSGQVLRFDGSKYVSSAVNYADLTNKPTLFSGDYADLTNKPVLFSGAYADLTGKPTLGSAAVKDVADFAAAVHTHVIADVTGLQDALDATLTKTAADADYATKVHTHVVADITDFGSAVDAKVEAAVAALPATDTSKVAVETVSTSSTLTASSHVVLAMGTITVTLPAPVNGKMIVVKNASASNTVTVDGGAATIDGAASISIADAYESITVVSNGTAWYVI